MVFAATMSETGEVIVDKDNSNNMGNFDAFDDPPEEPTILLKSFGSVVVILLERSYSGFLYLCRCFTNYGRVYSS